MYLSTGVFYPIQKIQYENPGFILRGVNTVYGHFVGLETKNRISSSNFGVNGFLGLNQLFQKNTFVDINKTSSKYGNYIYLDIRISGSYSIKKKYGLNLGAESNTLLLNINSDYVKNFKEPKVFVFTPFVKISRDLSNKSISLFYNHGITSLDRVTTVRADFIISKIGVAMDFKLK
ncbi:hypothetical protein [Lacihabitans sp. LS3-19]|uniref:hypothetical protein n=1 Tax=Lacihabitans sp. LS3-19 TaxID=2487335 RepID=UPI0020CED24A|nr:hypothetical protein [Lacihabitans sp. LS3-19]